MTILVAGSSGLVGSAIVRELIRLGERYVGISSKEIDLTNRAATFNFFKSIKPEKVIDAAAIVGGISANIQHPVKFLSKNIQIQTNLMDASHAFGVERFVFLGSSCMYPKDSIQPITEESLMAGKLEETNAPYAIAKIAGLELIRSYRKEFKHKWITVIPNNIYGPYDNFNQDTSHVFAALISKFTDAVRYNKRSVTLWGTGKPLREFLHSDDAAKAIMICLQSYDDDKPINIGNSNELSIKNLAEKIAKATNFKGEIIWNQSLPDGIVRKSLEISKIKGMGWNAQISIEEGIESTLRWYNSSYLD
jgi:GDP-L-fucose synthase